MGKIKIESKIMAKNQDVNKNKLNVVKYDICSPWNDSSN